MAKTKPVDDLIYPQNTGILRVLFGIGALGIFASFIGFFVDTKQFHFSYLTSFSYLASFSLASLFFVMLHHITRSSWGVTLRRIPETFSYQLFILAIMFIPILFGMEYLYKWTSPEILATDHLAQHKQPYLNQPFFIIRQIIYFSVWSFLGYRLYKNSVKMDENADWGLETLQRKISAPGILLFSLTVAFASFDWLMSLDFHWFSTMFGVYYFSMSFQAFFAMIILLGLFLRSRGLLLNTITRVHIGDAGKLMFGFTVFYAYIAFSQFFLIYYANIPEETLWYYHRLEGNWSVISYSLIIVRFAAPFLLLLSKAAKSNFTLLGISSVIIVVIHFLEMHWIVMPTLHYHGFSMHWLDISTLVGLGGLLLGFFFYQFQKHSMVPKNDPKFLESLNKH
ncbi:MAG: hypothetical protein EA364_03075 [Balneolaceae bacterium]|jgi:hypothetical protein|nr:MAG: hypothetical protein EA364_03075 [Balneolaceae bacterium]